MKFARLFDPPLFVPIIGLSSLSLSIIGSNNYTLFINQLLFIILGIFLYFLLGRIDYRIYGHLLSFMYFGSLLLLLLAFFGPSVRGATRWIDVFGIRIQSSEIIKPFIFIVFSSIISQKSIETKRNLAFSSFIFLPILLMVFKQPDLGNAIVFFGVFISLLIMGGISLIYLFLSSVVSAMLIPLAWHLLHDYQKARVISFFNPNSDPKGAGYNALQAIIAIGSGGLWGLGLGRGTQSHLLFLPEFHTDFVFASLVEEFGFIGGTVVISFYAILLLKILQIALSCEDKFGRLICIAIFTQILLQVFINIGMNLGILPITGITLPLISYGGSSLLSIFISLGLVSSVAARAHSHLLKED